MDTVNPTAAPEASTGGDPGAQDRKGRNSVASLKDSILNTLTYSVGKDPIAATDRDWFFAVALTVRDRVTTKWMESTRAAYAYNRKRVYYLSLEFLVGRVLFDALNNLGLTDSVRAAVRELGGDLDQLRDLEPDAALGNGGLGRLAACYMESMATLGLASHGYGIRYDHGLFRQEIKDGWQLEYPEEWLQFGNPWEFPRPEVDYTIGFGGHVEQSTDADGEVHMTWHPGDTVEAVAYDTPVVGWRGRHVNTLRLWSARSHNPLRLDAFNAGDYIGALSDRVRAESISKVLYPSDATAVGHELRLRQEYFFVSASLQDLIRRHIKQHEDIKTLHEFVAIQLNDTHPAIGVAELMRILVDLYHVEWKEAWKITQATFSFTNHTLLPEALETWPVPLLERLLPRHMQIIYLLNAFHLDLQRAAGHNDAGLLSSISIIDENGGRRVRMGHLAFLGSHKVNGVSALHTDLMRKTVFHDLHLIHPDRIVNKTNGITFRRWLFDANPGLTHLLVEAAGEGVLDKADALEQVAPLADDEAFRDRVMSVKRGNKKALAKQIQHLTGVKVNPDALFDVHVKRIHEYKRQLLNILETIAYYNAIRSRSAGNPVPRVKIFAGKAAASYHKAKLIIKLINDVAKVINSDPTVHGLLKVVFLPNYSVSLAESIIPAADLSEQISTAGMEASGTGNMKFALNGALTIGTLDGANVEIREKVGDENIFIFGLTAAEVEERRRRGIDANDTINGSPVLREVLDAIHAGVFSPDDPSRYRELVDVLHHSDYFLVAADFDAYYARQRTVDAKWLDTAAWSRSSVLNTAKVGWFSSDRAILEYADEIWNVPAQSRA
ncbi:MAG TPA: glycogen/starch/alpha-glucan phosphorylase [Magnetospirillaceae bacterium]|jgi:starch phosphorylase